MTDSEEWSDNLNPVIGALQRGHYLLYSQQIAPLGRAGGDRPFNEILIRLFEEERHLLPPGMFFPMLQEQGLMSLLDCWVVSQVLKLQHAALLARPGWIGPRNSINLSEDSVSDPEFSQFVVNQLAKWDPPRDTLSFEILGTIALEQREALRELIAALSPRGCSFGLGSITGASEELELIADLGVSFVKIDGSLVRKLLISPTNLARVAHINQSCHGLGIETVAEFVEDLETRAALTKIGVDYVQGFGISQPVPFLAEL